MPKHSHPRQLSPNRSRDKSLRIASKSFQRPAQQSTANRNLQDQKPFKKKQTSASKQYSVQIDKNQKTSSKVYTALTPSKRPSELTANIFSSLYNNPIRIQGLLQIIQQRKKRQRLYSVRLSDGFFRIKAFAKGQVAKELAKGTIRQFYILDCTVDFQGDKICELRAIKGVWNYGWSVGFTEPWRFGKLNSNPLGSNKIGWEKWDRFINKVTSDEEKVGVYQSTFNFNPTQAEEDTDTLSLLESNINQKSKELQQNFHSIKIEDVTLSINHPSPIISKSSTIKFNIKNQPSIKQEYQSIFKNPDLNIQKHTKSSLLPKSHKKHSPTPKKNKISTSKCLSQNKHEKMLIKTQHKQKVLRLNSMQNSDDSEHSNKLIFQNEQNQNLELTKGLKLDDKIDSREKNANCVENLHQKHEDSWDNFFNEYINFKNLNKCNDRTEFQTKVNKAKKHILLQLFEDLDSDGDCHPQSFNKKQTPKSKIWVKQSQTLTPQPEKSKNFPFQLFDQTQPVPNTLITSSNKSDERKDIQYEQAFEMENQAIASKDEKISLRIPSKQLSNLKKNQNNNMTKSFFQEIMVQVAKEFEEKVHKEQFSKFDDKYSHRQVQIQFKQPLSKQLPSKQQNYQNCSKNSLQGEFSNEGKERRIIQVSDLLDTSTLIQIKQAKCSWALKVKILYIDCDRLSRAGKHEPHNPEMTDKIAKNNFIKCLGVSQDDLHMCLLMINGQRIQMCKLVQNQTYIIEAPKFVEKKIKNDEYQNKIPHCMLDQWIEVGKQSTIEKTDKKLSLKNKIEQQWLSQLHEIEVGKTGDVINVMGFLKSVKQRQKNCCKSKFDCSNDETNFGCYSIKSQTNKAYHSRLLPMVQLQIIDPFTGYTVQITNFNSQNPKPQPYLPVIIFMAQIHVHRNKKSLTSRPDTVIVYNRFLPTFRISRLFQFYQQNQNRLPDLLENMEVQLVGYYRATDILEACEYEQAAKIHLDQCQVFSITRVCYIGCKYCHKKIFNDQCPGCGPCGKDDVFERVLLTGLVSDSSGSFKFFMDKQTADRALADHVQSNVKRLKEGQSGSHIIYGNLDQLQEQVNPWRAKQASIQQLLALELVELWFTFQGQDKPISIDKILLAQKGYSLQNALEEFTQIPLDDSGQINPLEPTIFMEILEEIEDV